MALAPSAKLEAHTRIQARMTPGERRMIDAFAKANGFSRRSEAIRALITRALEDERGPARRLSS